MADDVYSEKNLASSQTPLESTPTETTAPWDVQLEADQILREALDVKPKSSMNLAEQATVRGTAQLDIGRRAITGAEVQQASQPGGLSIPGGIGYPHPGNLRGH